MKTLIWIGCACLLALNVNAGPGRKSQPDARLPAKIPGYKLVWNDEFDYKGKPDPEYWDYEAGFVRNEELQWYQPGNANCRRHVLVIEGRRERMDNPDYEEGSRSWIKSRPYAQYTSASIMTKGKKSWKFGRFEIRARIPAVQGAWPAIWTLGVDKEWPSNGEIDLMEFYLVEGEPSILSNAAWGTVNRGQAAWDSSHKRLQEIMLENKDRKWADRFHIWRMDWTEEQILLYLDDVLLNSIDLTKTINPDGFNPFHQEHYLLLNLALGKNGGDPSQTDFPLRYEVDYVRIYQKINE